MVLFSNLATNSMHLHADTHMKTTRSFLAYFQLVLLCTILISNALFMHSHVSHGHLVMHVHPYSFDESGDSATHEHSDDELVFYDFLAHQAIVHDESFVGLEVFRTAIMETYQAPAVDDHMLRCPYDDSPTLRGPPRFS